MVRAIDVRTIGLGGDSEVLLGPQGKLSISTQRIVPVALIGQRYPEVLAMLQADLADVDGGNSMQGRFVLLPFGARADSPTGELTAREREVLDQIGERPQALRKVASSLSAQRAISSLRRKGLVQLSGFTPSDAAHVLGLQANWSSEAAKLAGQLGARLREMKFPTPERTEQFARDVWNETVRLTGRAILDTALGVKLADDQLVDAVCRGQTLLGLATISLKPSVPVVAVGGPVKVYYPEVARRLGCDMVFPDYCDVANAVGAATGVVAQTVVVRVAGDGSGVFVVHSTVGTQQYRDPAEALGRATELAREAARTAVLAMGAQAPEVKLTLQKTMLPNATSDTGLLEAVITAEAIGRPNAAA
jgi:N-methylhydantoinase A/oxoprolinase/acetone carboxylase beta subunit